MKCCSSLVTIRTTLLHTVSCRRISDYPDPDIISFFCSLPDTVGSTQVGIAELADDLKHVQGPLNKAYKLRASDNRSGTNSVIYLKLDLQFFRD
jgi:hypothetical protein